jgi:uncharacterized repeat protein (TIGR03943 family)
MKKIGGIIEAILLQAIGAYAGILVLFGNYWRFLNPKFMWLTGATAAALIFTGMVAMFNPNRRFRLSRIIVFILFLRIFTMGISGSASFVKGFTAGMQSKSFTEQKSRSVMNGREYIQINLAELYLVCEKPIPEKIAKRYVVQGIVRQSRALRNLDQFALMRTAVFCCIADAVAMGFRIPYERLDELTDGQWVKVYGTLKPSNHKLPEPALQTQGFLPPVLSDAYLFIPEKIVPIKEPAIPFMFEFRKREPYSY